MPVKSAAQFRLMKAAESGNADKIGAPPTAVAKEFLAKTSKKKKSIFAKKKKSGKFNPFEKK